MSFLALSLFSSRVLSIMVELIIDGDDVSIKSTDYCWFLSNSSLTRSSSFKWFSSHSSTDIL